ncbi:DUF4174 domain-containing protein [Salinicola aestuarinus]|uniref:DUF4174 domain-containing protein n=1 Tax=Salinicola aestuarinus TaxID=1949082 RepID=UPI001FD8E881|nr:DUF4174 domain-containing protein [Salinicola aestuarinus]
MKRWWIMAAVAAAAIGAWSAQAQADAKPQATTPSTDAANPLITDKWQFRPLILVTPSAEAPAYRALREQLAQTDTQFRDREMLLYTVENGEGTRHGKPMTPYETRALLDALGVDAHQGVTLVLVGKDGGKKIEQHGIVDLQQVYDTIDRMPMRQAERNG